MELLKVIEHLKAIISIITHEIVFSREIFKGIIGLMTLKNKNLICHHQAHFFQINIESNHYGLV